jgi:phosphomannomutase / phosphoglucomutase
VTDINPFIFRAYDVRGKAGIDITPEVFAEVGRAFGTLVRRRGGHAVALGMDNRTTSPSLKESFGAGVLSTTRRSCTSRWRTGSSTAARR